MIKVTHFSVGVKGRAYKLLKLKKEHVMTNEQNEEIIRWVEERGYNVICVTKKI